ncbi:MAG: enoyl-CoA hydratase/isomerase family protein [Myxococcota bacterium]
MISPAPETLDVLRDGGLLRVVLNRPRKRNAMSLLMVTELEAVFAAVEADETVRVVVLRGAEGHFCAGGDVSDMATAAGKAVDGVDPIAAMNLRFGKMLRMVDASRAAVVAVCEGAVMGGGLGLACVADVTLAVSTARFRLPETSLGLPPAQIAPFMVRRLGLSQARRLAVTGQTLDAAQALSLGLAHEHVGADQVNDAVERLLGQILRCEPGAVGETKRLVNAAAVEPLSDVLQAGAQAFAAAARSPLAAAGFQAFLRKKSPPWASGVGE